MARFCAGRLAVELRFCRARCRTGRERRATGGRRALRAICDRASRRPCRHRVISSSFLKVTLTLSAADFWPPTAAWRRLTRRGPHKGHLDAASRGSVSAFALWMARPPTKAIHSPANIPPEWTSKYYQPYSARMFSDQECSPVHPCDTGLPKPAPAALNTKIPIPGVRLQACPAVVAEASQFWLKGNVSLRCLIEARSLERAFVRTASFEYE
jgi:hypothetical protein